MADLTITDANVQLMENVPLRDMVVGQLGETVTRMQPVYLASSGKYLRADANVSATEAAAVGVTLSGGVLDDYALILRAGKVDPGAAVTKGVVYAVSATAGAIAPIGDLTAGQFITILGPATAADTIDIDINATGATV